MDKHETTCKNTKKGTLHANSFRDFPRMYTAGEDLENSQFNFIMQKKTHILSNHSRFFLPNAQKHNQKVPPQKGTNHTQDDTMSRSIAQLHALLIHCVTTEQATLVQKSDDCKLMVSGDFGRSNFLFNRHEKTWVVKTCKKNAQQCTLSQNLHYAKKQHKLCNNATHSKFLDDVQNYENYATYSPMSRKKNKA